MPSINAEIRFRLSPIFFIRVLSLSEAAAAANANVS
jgi:hypothetical protein